MLDFKIRRGLSTDLFTVDGEGKINYTAHNPLIALEEGCWYLCTDTAELFLGVVENNELKLKQINDKNEAGYGEIDLSDYAKLTDIPDVSEFIKEIPSEYVTEAELLAKKYLTEHQSLAEYAKKSEIPSVEGLASEEFVVKKIAEAELADQDVDLSTYYTKSETETVINEAIEAIEIPEAEIYKVDFNAPDYAKAVEAYNNGKVLVLINAAPDINSYAVMNYVRDDIISFTKFLMSRSGTYGSFNTYYLHNDGTWEFAKEVKLNKVEANVEGEVNGELASIRIGKEIYSIPSTDGLASIEYVDNAIAGIEIPEQEKIDLSEYAKLTDIPDVSKFIEEVPAEYVTEDELDGKGFLTEHQSLEGYAKKDELFSKDYNDLTNKPELFSGSYNDLSDKPEIPSIDGLATEEFVNTAVAEKADNVPFTTSKIVTSAVGGFNVGDDVKGLTIAEIFAKLLGLSDKEQGIIETIKSDKLPMYAVTTEKTLSEVPYKFLELTEEEAELQPTESGFYQIKDTEGNVIESGYQELQVNNDTVYYIIALPKEVDYNTMVDIVGYDTASNSWMKAEKFDFTSDPEDVAALCDEAGVDISHIDSNVYTVWASDVCPTGSILRYIIKE